MIPTRLWYLFTYDIHVSMIPSPPRGDKHASYDTCFAMLAAIGSGQGVQVKIPLGAQNHFLVRENNAKLRNQPHTSFAPVSVIFFLWTEGGKAK